MLTHQITDQAVTNPMSTEYICRLSFDNCLVDEAAWLMTLLEFGLHRESFSLVSSSGGNVVLKFWEPDRREALRILANLDGMRAVNA